MTSLLSLGTVAIVNYAPLKLRKQASIYPSALHPSSQNRAEPLSQQSLFQGLLNKPSYKGHEGSG